MKLAKIKGFLILMAAFLAVAGLGENSCFAAVTVTVTPSTTSNTYTGPITLNITGLSGGEQVKVQTYLDLNDSGVVTANDPLVDVFNIADGGAEVIGGITNVSVPYDSNLAAGAITTTLNFNLPLESMVGQKIYRVISNPAGAFTPVTATLDVTNASIGQSISGVIYSNGVAPLPYGIVAVLTVTNQNYVNGVVANASGQYSLTLNPGAYFLIPAMPGFYANQDLAPEVTLTNGGSATNNLTLFNGTVPISGSIFDAVSSNGLGGVFFQAQCQASQTQSLFEVAFTDTNGNFTVGATSNNWKIKISDERLSRRGYLAPQNNALTAFAGSGPVTGADIGLDKGNALFYGQVTISNLPVPNVAVGCNDSEQLFSSKGYTDANGNYGVVALVGTNAFGTNSVSWNCAPDVSDESGAMSGAFANYIFSYVNSVNIASNQSVLQNFIGLPITATISGQLVNNQGIPIPNISVGANNSTNGNQFTTAYVTTDNNGDFSFGAANGQWYVNANCCGSDGLDDIGYYDPVNLHVVNIPPNNPVQIVVYPANLPVLAQPGKVSPSQFNLNLYGVNGDNYTIQSSTNLETANWATFATVTNLPSSPYLIEDFQATNAARFYRAFESQ
ncbi:MAG TPA: carboxypeptidase-like regulatory domain-containing protein [Verrucomicrobiae bacterium]|jgi:hypothetical protein